MIFTIIQKPKIQKRAAFRGAKINQDLGKKKEKENIDPFKQNKNMLPKNTKKPATTMIQTGLSDLSHVVKPLS